MQTTESEDRERRFSGETLAALIEVVAGAYSHSELGLLFMRLKCQDCDQGERRENAPNKIARIRNVVSALKRRGPQPRADLFELTRILLEERFRDRIYDWQGQVVDSLRHLVTALQVDGFEIREGRLIPITSEITPLAEQLSLLEVTLAQRGLRVALQHYRQAVDNFRAGNLEASNGQLRSFLENLVLELHSQATGRQAGNPKGAVDGLRNGGNIDGDEANLLKGLVGISNQRGAHAGLTDHEEGLFRMHFSTASARWLLSRMPKGPVRNESR